MPKISKTTATGLLGLLILGGQTVQEHLASGAPLDWRQLATGLIVAAIGKFAADHTASQQGAH